MFFVNLLDDQDEKPLRNNRKGFATNKLWSLDLDFGSLAAVFGGRGLPLQDS